MRKTYPTDLSDAEWTRLRSFLPTPKAEGRPRTHSLRDVLDAIFYVLKSGCHWRLLPHDFPLWSTVYYHFRRFRLSGLWSLILKVLRAAERKRVGKNPQPTAAIVDSQSVKTVEESAHPRASVIAIELPHGSHDARRNPMRPQPLQHRVPCPSLPPKLRGRAPRTSSATPSLWQRPPQWG